VKLHGLPGDDVFDPAREMPPFDIGVGIKLDHKRTVHGQGARLVIWVWPKPSSCGARWAPTLPPLLGPSIASRGGGSPENVLKKC